MFTEIFKVPSKNLIGLDIRPHQVNLALVNLQNKKFVLTGFGVAELTATQNTAQAISKAYNQLHTDIKQIAIALPPSAIFFKELLIDDIDVSPQEFEEYVLTEVSQFIPLPINEIALDFQIHHPLKTSEKIPALVAATRKSTLKNLQKIINQAGLELTVVDVESTVIHNFLKFLLNSFKTIGFIQIFPTQVNFLVFNSEKCIFNHIEIIQADLGCHPQAFDLITEGVQKFLKFYFSQQKQEIAELYITENNFSNLLPTLSENIGVKISQIRLFEKINLAPHLENQIINHSPFLSVGLSMRDIL